MEIALKEFPKLSVAEVARICAVSRPMVDSVKPAQDADSAPSKATGADKQRAIEIALREFPKLSSEELGKICAVSPRTVEAYRRANSANCGVEKRTGADGKSYPATKPARAQTVDTPAADPSKPAPREIVVHLCAGHMSELL